jgi:hypothetical protein
MSAASATATPTSKPPTKSTTPVCSPESLQTLKVAFEALVSEPWSEEHWDSVQRAIEELAPSDPQFFADLKTARRHQLHKHGGFSQRYVLSKDVGHDGKVRALPRPIPVRDDTSSKLARVVRDNPSSFPGGIQDLLDKERPLQHAKSPDYAKLIAATVRVELDSLLKGDRNKLLKSSATLLDLLETYRHLHRVAGAHPKVIETIDANDTTAMLEFLITVASRTPLTEAELTRLVPLAADDWKQATDKDLIVRGRVLQTGLAAKTALLKTWVQPFAAEVVFRGLLTDLQEAFRKRVALTAQPVAAERPTPPPRPTPTPAPTSVPATTGTFSAPMRPLAQRPAPAANLSDTSPVDLSSTDAFRIPIGVPEPPRLHVLRNYVRVSSTGTVVRLSEAMRLCEAKDDIVGHRQYVQRVFHEEGWAIIGQTRGDPMFSRLGTSSSGTNAQ